MTGRIISRPEEAEKPGQPELRQAVSRDLDELGQVVQRSRQATANRLSAENTRTLQELSRLVGLKLNPADQQRFNDGKEYRINGAFTTVPKLPAKNIEAFVRKYGITLLDGDDIQKLASGQEFIIGGTFDKPPSAQDIRKLQKLGIHIGVYEDGRIYISNRPGYLMQQLANNGVSVQLMPTGDVVLSNELYAPRSMPEELVSKLERGLTLARARSELGDVEGAIKIIGIMQNILNAYRLAGDYDSLARLAAPFLGIGLSKQEWSQMKKEFGDAEFREISGAGHADFEKLGLSLGELARWKAMEARQLAMKVADTYEDALGNFLENRGKKAIDDAERECDKTKAALAMAEMSASRAATLLSSLPAITAARARSADVMDMPIPAAVKQEMPDVAEAAENIKKRSAECLWSVESYTKYVAFYSLAALSYLAAGEQEKAAAMKAKSEKALGSISRTVDKLEEAEGRFRRIVNASAETIAFMKELHGVRQKLDAIRAATEEGSPLNEIEKDLIRGIFSEGAHVSMAEAARMVEHYSDIASTPELEVAASLYALGTKSKEVESIRKLLNAYYQSIGTPQGELLFADLVKAIDSLGVSDDWSRQSLKEQIEQGRKYFVALNAIHFAHPLTWRFRMARLDEETAMRFPDTVSTSRMTPVAFTQQARPRTIANVVQEERIAADIEKYRPRVEETLRQKRLAILADADVAVGRLRMLLPPERAQGAAGPLQASVAGAMATAATARRKGEQNATAQLDDSLKKLQARTGARDKLAFRELTAFAGDYTDAYTKACQGVYDVLEKRAFENAVSRLPWHREYLARSARFLDRNGETVMWAAAAVGAVVGVVTSAGAASTVEGAAGRVAAGAAIRFIVRRYSVAAIRGAVGYLGLSSRVLALTSASTAGGLYLATVGLPKGEAATERQLAKAMLGRSVQYGVYGLIRTAPPGLKIPTMVYSRLGLASHALVIGGSAFNIYDSLYKSPPPGLTPAEEYAYRMKAGVSYGDVIYLSIALGLPALRLSARFLRGLKGFEEVGVFARARAGFRMALDFKQLYGTGIPAFQRGDVVMAGFFAADPFVMSGLEGVINSHMELLRTPAERELAEITPRRLTPSLMGAAGAPAAELLGAEYSDVLPLSLYLGMTRPQRGKSSD